MKLAIIGGGPGGLYAAQQLSTRGFDVAGLRSLSLAWPEGVR